MPVSPIRIYLIIHPNRFFGRSDFGWKSVDVGMLVEQLSTNFEVHIVSIINAPSIEAKKEDYVLYSSSDAQPIREYYKDVMYLLDSQTNVVPRLPLLLAHENKGFQELLRKELGISELHGEYLFDVDDIQHSPPFVFKTVDGAGSSGVHLVRNRRDIERLRRKYFSPSLLRHLMTLVRRFTLKRPDFTMYRYRHKGFWPFVVQDFVPNLPGDYKVLVFADHYYALRRSVRPDDFRASGSGRFRFDTQPNSDVLDFAKSVFERLDCPYISLDIAQKSDGSCCLIEFQALHFGPYTLMRSPGYFVQQDGAWQFVEGRSKLESEMSHAVVQFILGRVRAQAAV